MRVIEHTFSTIDAKGFLAGSFYGLILGHGPMLKHTPDWIPFACGFGVKP